MGKFKNIIIEKNNNLSNIFIGFYFHGGVLFENGKVFGMSHLLEHLFFRKMNEIPQNKLYKRLNKIGVSLRGYTCKDYICFCASIIPKYFNEFIDVIINVYEDFEWNEDEIKKEKEVVKRQIEEKGYSYFDDIADSNYYQGSCFKNRIIGDVWKIDSFSCNLINDYKKRFFNKDNSIIVMTGNFSDENVSYLSEKLDKIKDFPFKELKRQNTMPKNFCKRNDKNRIIISSYYDVNDIEIRIDLSRDVNLNMSEALFNILAVGDGAKIPYKLKDSLGYIGDLDSDTINYEDFNFVILRCSVDNIHLIETLNIIFEEMKNIKTNITEEDLEENILFLTDFSSITDSVEDYNEMIGYEKFVLGHSNFSVKNEINSFEKITVKDLKMTAQKIFKSENISIYVENNSRIERKYKVLECINRGLLSL